MQSKTLYYPQLDGLRAIAVILVLLVHSGFSLFKTGWIGVPVFFVLSGFLITKILLDNKTGNNFFKVFYFRRMLRIFPIYYLVLFFCLGWGIIFHYSIAHFMYYAFYLQSFLISHNIQPSFVNTLLAHTWSLSVEEIFYLFWPFLVYLLSNKKLKIVCITVIIFSIAYKFKQLYNGTEALAFLSIWGHLDSLMIGALLALYVNTMHEVIFKLSFKIQLIIVFALTLGAILTQYFVSEKNMYFFFEIVLCMLTGWLTFYIILLFTSTKNNSKFIIKVFSNKVLVFIGKISYGLYLYHFVVYMFVASFLYHYKISLNSKLELLLKIAVTFFFSIISWQLIEKPILKLKSKLKY